MVRLIAFLGNKGIQYKSTRHNSGWMVCDHVCHISSTSLHWTEKFHGTWASLALGLEKVILLKPLTFMNESGLSIGEASRWFGIDAKDIMIVHDDVELPFGTVKLQVGGGLGGHNGLRSATTHLGTTEFVRLRIGIGRPSGRDMATFVLSHFSSEEEISLPLVLVLASNLITESLAKNLSSLPILKSIPLPG